MSFSDPLYLLVLLPALAWLFFVARRIHGVARARRRFAVGLRAAILILVGLALAGLQSVRTNRGVSTVFVLDRSASMSADALREAEAFIRRSLDARGPDDAAGLVVFGKDPMVDVNTGSLRSLGKVYTQPEPSASDLAAAVRLATATFPAGRARRLVLLSDGNETSGDAAQAAAVAATDGVQIDYVALQGAERPGGEVVLTETLVPARITRGEPFEVKVLAEATEPASGVIRLDRDGVPVARVPVQLSKGQNTLVVSQTAPGPGFYRYRAVLETDTDADARNNVGMGFVAVQGRPRVLLVEGAPGASEALERALELHDIDVTRTGAEGLPNVAAEAQEYDSLLLSDFPADRMTDRHMRLLAGAVRDSGVGFGMIGGENSFLPGGYFETPIADVLPVDLNVRQRKVFPSSTILIVVDASGSMAMQEDGVEKIKIAATAAAATVRMMTAMDRVGVAGSTDAIEFVAPIQSARDKERIAALTGRLDVGGGGIYIRPSLEFAYENLRKQNTRVRHLILLADGADSDEQGGALELARRMVAEKITISVVSIGDGKDVPFLKVLAAVGKGNFYLATQARQLQRMFTRDAALMGRSAVEEGAFLPKVDPSDEVLRGLDLRSMPPLYAYDLTSDRPLARVPMRTGKDDPLLAFWQYGLGASMAFTSDAQPRWARPWITWPGFHTFWAQATRSTLRRASGNRVQVVTRRDGGRGVVDVEAFDPSGAPINGLAARVRVLSPDGEAQEVPIRQEGPGRYQGRFDASTPGGYVVTVAEGSAGGAPRVTRAGFAIAYPPEYQAIRPNTELLASMARATGGEPLDAPARAFRPSGNPGRSVRDLWPALLLAAALLFPLDVAARRLALPVGELWAAVARRWRRAPRAVPAPSAPAGAIAQLRDAKNRAAIPRDEDAVPMAQPAEIRAAPPPEGRPAPPPAPPEGGPPISAAQRLLEARRQREHKQ